jgi:hypothetical protein
MNNYLVYLSRIIICIALVAAYLFLWRPVRLDISQQIIEPVFVHAQQLPLIHPYKVKQDGASIHIIFNWRGNINTIQYQPQAGFFFLIALLTFVLIAAELRWYAALFALHIAAMVIVGGIMLLSRNGWYAGFFIVNFLVSYIIPAVTLAMAVWVIVIHRAKKDEVKAFAVE